MHTVGAMVGSNVGVVVGTWWNGTKASEAERDPVKLPLSEVVAQESRQVMLNGDRDAD